MVNVRSAACNGASRIRLLVCILSAICVHVVFVQWSFEQVDLHAAPRFVPILSFEQGMHGSYMRGMQIEYLVAQSRFSIGYSESWVLGVACPTGFLVWAVPRVMGGMIVAGVVGLIIWVGSTAAMAILVVCLVVSARMIHCMIYTSDDEAR